MELGLKNKSAIVCAASKGLGRACAFALAREGVNITICARSQAPLEETATAIRNATGVSVTTVACDVTSEAGRAEILAACPQPDILVNNAGGPPPGDFKDFTMDDWRRAVEGNMITPIALIHATVYGMIERGFGRIVNITSASVKNPIAILELSNGARCGLTGGVAALARKTIASGVTINALLPGLHDTDRIQNLMAERAKAQNVSLDMAAAQLAEDIPAKRLGNPEDFGAVCAFLCSTRAGFITGQNILIDGGAFPGTL